MLEALRRKDGAISEWSAFDWLFLAYLLAIVLYVIRGWMIRQAALQAANSAVTLGVVLKTRDEVAHLRAFLRPGMGIAPPTIDVIPDSVTVGE